MRGKRKRAAVLTLAMALLLNGAFAVQALGQSAADEYTEGVPGAGGEHPSSGKGGSKSGGSSSKPTAPSGTSSGTEAVTPEPTPLPAQSAKELKSLGKDGKAAAELAQATAPSHDVAPASDESDSSGTGILLPLILVGSLSAVVTFLLVRRRGPTSPG